MTEALQLAGDAIAEAQQVAARASEELRAAYLRLFTGTPTRDDQVVVLRDLKRFCGMRTAILRGTFHDTAEAAGKMRVWQRIDAFLDLDERRPPDARLSGGTHERAEPDNRPIASGGVADATDD